jgi:hypothetical protein
VVTLLEIKCVISLTFQIIMLIVIDIHASFTQTDAEDVWSILSVFVAHFTAMLLSQTATSTVAIIAE